MSNNETITKEQFNMYIATLEYSIKKNVPYYKIDTKNDIYGLKWYIKDHKNEKDVKDFLKWVAKTYINLILTDDLKDALNIDSKYKYDRIQKVCAAYPFRKNSFVIFQLYSILYIEDEDNKYSSGIYRTLERYLKEYRILYDVETYHKFIDFIDNYKGLPFFEGGYKPLNPEDAGERYIKCINNNYEVYNTKHYLDFKADVLLSEMLYEDEIHNRYENKLLGNIGELYAAYALQCENKNGLYLSAFSAGDGLGYDIYYNELDQSTGNVREKLVEVKTTEKDFQVIDNDYFSLSRNEYNFMCERLRNNDADYMVIRVFSTLARDKDITKSFSYGVLYPIDENTLVSEGNPQMIYDIKYEQTDGKYYCTLRENTRKRN